MERVNKEEICQPIVFSEEFIAVFLVKVSQIQTEKKNKKTSKFPILMHF